jgi:hypothetical protein
MCSDNHAGDGKNAQNNVHFDFFAYKRPEDESAGTKSKKLCDAEP